MANEPTPLMQLYAELKEQAGDALLFFRMGDFYELFGDDAVEAAKILEITLTSRDKNKPDPLPMAGVPHHSAGNYVQKLLNASRKYIIDLRCAASYYYSNRLGLFRLVLIPYKVCQS
jgi:DNA mismatch repair protein MutS